MSDALLTHTDGTCRCFWVGDSELYREYHDMEWGVPETDDRALFEKLILDGFQAGLSWITILRKRDNFRKAFAHFEPEKIAGFNESDVERLMQDAGIVRNRAKITAAIKSAQVWLSIQEQGSFSDFLWDFVDGKPVQNNLRRKEDILTETAESIKMSKALKQKGFNFCGPTIVYAFMQAVGMVNDHFVGCHSYLKCEAMAKPFEKGKVAE